MIQKETFDDQRKSKNNSEAPSPDNIELDEVTPSGNGEQQFQETIQALPEGIYNLLELISSGESLKSCLSSLCRTASRLTPGLRVSVTLTDEHGTFKRPIAPDLSPSFKDKREGTPVDDVSSGTCAKAVHESKPAKSADIANDAEWSQEWHDLYLEEYIKASYSRPIFDKDERAIGCLMLCFDEPREPFEWECKLAEFGAYIASIVVERDRSRLLRDRFRAALEIDTVGVIFWNREYKITEVNDAFLRMSGFSHKEAVGLSWQELTVKKFYPRSKKAVKEITTKGHTKPYEKQYIRKDGSRWWGLFAPRQLESGETAEFVLDITERKKAEEQLQQMNDKLEERVEERTASLLSYQDQLRSLASKLSKAEEMERQRLATELHDNLGQMLAVTKMKIDLLQKDPTGEEAAGDIEEIRQGVVDALIYTRDLMSDLKPPPSLDKEDITATIEWLAKKMEKHDLEVVVEDDGRQKRASEDIRTTLLQCVREVLFNIIKHAGVSVAHISLSRINNKVQIVVEDEGKGFEPAGDTSVSSGDSGFGLFNISERMDLLGGEVQIDSEPGKGTRVTLIAPTKDYEEPDQSPEDEEKKEHFKTSERNKKLKVMLVDDHQMMREGLKKIVDAEDDLTVIAEASNGEEAVEMARDKSPDIIVMDVNMPRMNGIDATKEIMSIMPEVRIVALSLHDHQKVIDSMRSAGATAYLTKNEAFETLCATIRSEGASKK